jgi:hypothetical protein
MGAFTKGSERRCLQFIGCFFSVTNVIGISDVGIVHHAILRLTHDANQVLGNGHEFFGADVESGSSDISYAMKRLFSRYLYNHDKLSCEVRLWMHAVYAAGWFPRARI